MLRHRFVRLALSSLIFGLMGLPVIAAPAAGADPAPGPEQRAVQLAKATGKQVAVPELTSETQLVAANPDGSFTAKIHSGPARFKDSSGSWVDIDLELVSRVDGSVTPRGHQNGLVLAGKSGQGVHDLAKLTAAGHEISLGWRGFLPEPVLSGSKATWPDVHPGVDLVVEATRSGFEQFIVVKNRAALAYVRSMSFPWRASGLTEKAGSDGSLELSKPDGIVVARIPAARMWDARKGRSGDPVASAKVDVKVRHEPAKGASVSASVDLAVVPDAKFLDDSRIEFPLTIDPSVVTLTAGFDAFVQTGYVDDQSGNGDLKLGYSDEFGTYTARSYLRYDNLSGYAGASVQSAVLYLWEYHSWSCTAASWESWRVNWADASLRWTKQPTWEKIAGSSNLTRGHDAGCDDGWVSIDVAGALQHAFSNSSASQAIGLKATSETNHDGWKRFHSGQAANAPYISVTYNRAPAAPASLKAQGKACATGMTVSTTAGQPQLQATMTDPDGDGMTAKFYIAQQGAAIPSAPTASTTVSSGTVATVTVPASVSLVEGLSYVWQAEGVDASAAGPRSTCEFKVDNGTSQTPPIVTSDGVYPRNNAGGGPGVAGRFTFAPNGVSTVDRYQYRFIYRGQTTPWMTRTTSAGATTTVLWTPPFDDGLSTSPVPVEQLNMGGQAKLEVKMGNPNIGWFNNVETFTTQVRSAPGVATHFTMDDDETSTVLIDEVNRSETLPNGQRPATVYNLAKSAEHRGDYGTSWYFNGTNAYAEGPSPLVLHPSSTYQSDSFSVSAWVRLADKDADHAVLANKSGIYDMFKLEYNKASDRWMFSVDSGDALSVSVPQVGVWTHLACTFDFTTRDMRIYVNGMQEGELPSMVDSYSDDVTTIAVGRSRYAYWHGEIDDVRLWPRVLDPREVAAQASVESAAWSLDNTLVSGNGSPFEPYDLTANDQNGTVDITSDVSLPAQAAWWSPVGHATGDGGSIRLSDASKQWLGFQPAMTSGVVRTAESFTVSAWVHLDTMPAGPDGYTWTAVAQDSVCRSGFFLGVKMVSGQANWFFNLPDRDTAADGVTCDSPGGVQISTPVTTAHIGQTGSGESAKDVWAQLVGVFDAAAGKTNLFVNGQQAGVAARSARWSAAGMFTIGRAQWPNAGAANPTDFFTGRIDSVRISQGAQAPETVTRNFLLDGGVIAPVETRVPTVAASGSAACGVAEGPDKVIDGVTGNNSKWCSSAASKWVQVQTAAAQPLTSVLIYHAVGGGEWQPSFDTKDYDILTSTDGSTWSTAMQVRGNTGGASRHTFTSPINAKYVKLNVLTPEQGGGSVARIFEIILYKAAKIPVVAATSSWTTGLCSATEGPEKAGDANFSTKFCGYTREIRLDLGSQKQINSAVLWHAGSGGEYPGWNTVAFDLFASTDGVRWTLLQQVRTNEAAVSIHDLKYPATARYFKADITVSAPDPNNWARLIEIEVF